MFLKKMVELSHYLDKKFLEKSRWIMLVISRKGTETVGNRVTEIEYASTNITIATISYLIAQDNFKYLKSTSTNWVI